MRHKKGGRKLNRTSAHRKALNRNLARSLVLHGRIKTTLPKAKEMLPFASRLVTLAQEGSLSARRRAIQLMGDSDVVGRLFSEIAPRFADRHGGYLRIVRLPIGRLGDRAPEAFVEFVEEETAQAQETEKKKKKVHKKLSKRAKREQAKKERKKHDIKKRAETAKAETEAEKEADEEVEESPEHAEPETPREPEKTEESQEPGKTEEPEK